MALCIYDKRTTQQSLEENNCGLGVIKPSRMKTVEEENGDYSLSLEYPMTDSDTMWKYIMPYAIVRNSEEQLFQIHTCSTNFSNGRAVMAAEASHISYFLADKVVENYTFPEGVGVDCHDALQGLWNHTRRWWGDGPGSGMQEYEFRFSSDMKYQNWKYNQVYDNVNLISAILGAENSIVSLYGGYIHRNNFDISINSRKEGSRENAFSIVHGLNMLEITERVCTKDYITSVYGTDNFGNKCTIYNKVSLDSPHEIFKNIEFSYSDSCDDNMERLLNDCNKYWSKYHAGFDVSYEVRFKDLKNIEKYKEWRKLQSYKIGDTGTVYSERLGINITAKIISRTVNDITGETEAITLGSFSPSLWRNDRFGIVSSGKRLTALEKVKTFDMFTLEDD